MSNFIYQKNEVQVIFWKRFRKKKTFPKQFSFLIFYNSEKICSPLLKSYDTAF